MSNRTRIIKSLPLIAVLFTCVVILSSAAIFASEESTPSSEVSSYLAPDNSSLVAKEIAEEVYEKLSSDTRASYTIDDVYNILYGALRGQSRTSVYNLPRIATYLNRIEQWIATGTSDPTSASATITGLLSQINAHAQSTANSVTGTGSMSNIKLWDFLYRLVPLNNLGTNQFPLVYSPVGSSSSFTLAELEFTIANTLTRHFSGTNGVYIDTLLNTIASNSYSTNTALSAINASINSSGNITWTHYNSSYLGTSYGLNYNFLSSDAVTQTFYVAFNLAEEVNPGVFRITLPLVYNSRDIDFSNFVLTNIYSNYNQSSTYVDIVVPDYFIELGQNCTYVYLYNFQFYGGFNYFFRFQNSQNLTFRPSWYKSIDYIPFDTDDYQIMKTAFYQAKSANAQGSMSSDVKRLADYLADPDKIAAENASQGVIDDTLDGFTGSGSAAAKGSDIGSMKNISGSVQSGLDTGAGVSNATNVFTLNGGFWGWFTQSNSDQINNPYPAPVVNNNRKSSGDEVVDFLSDNQSQVKDLLGDSKW